jgi:molecular chaperone DnaK (HSP70)
MPSRYLIGIDLGTTNSVVAYIDTQATVDASAPIVVLPIPQVVAPGEVRALAALPSFLYFPTEQELYGGGVVATWNEQPAMLTGVLAREQGALVPSRQVSSAKSWLSHPGVHRHSRILPTQTEGSQPRISPVEASARYLMHLRDAWNGALGSGTEEHFEQQEIVLTIPGSFDEEARELTVEAARKAKLESVTLLEEPLAALYAWIAANPDALKGTSQAIRDGELILICDIGGGTTDFSLVRTRLLDGELQFERIAIGDHLLLGGDNLDLALARHIENKLGSGKLTLRQRYALRRTCCAAKERLLGDSSLTSLPVTILGSGGAVIGQAIGAELTREEVLEILTQGFLPITSADDMPAAGRATGLRELGLPYASDPAITKHLAAFLRQAAANLKDSRVSGQMARPDAVLFNGGFCAPSAARERIIKAISSWFVPVDGSWRPRVLNNAAVDSAVARGAAYYGRVRRGAGHRIRAGNARSYYIGLPSENGLKGVCVLPAGVEEGTTLPLADRDFSVLANRPVSFALYSSRTRHAAHAEIVALNEADMHRHPPLVSLLRYGKKMRDVYLTIGLRATFTEVGTLELWCESRSSPHRWRLQFELREEEAQAEQLDTGEAQPGRNRRPVVATSDANVESAVQLIGKVFGAPHDGTMAPEMLIPEMELALNAKRDSWPITAVRRFADVLLECAGGRKESAGHEMRWLNLCGFCLRPGFGAAGDDARVRELRRMAAGPVFQDDLQCQIAALVALRRILGGINASEQQAMYRAYTTVPLYKKKRINRQLEYEKWRMLASLEHLISGTRALLGKELLAKIKKEPGDSMWLWSLGRLGARIPLYGPLHCVVSSEIASEWVRTLLGLPAFAAATASAIALIGRRTNDRSRDIDEQIREKAISRMNEAGVAEEVIRLLSQYVSPSRADAAHSLGESLPPGLEPVSSPNCLLSVPAFTSVKSF